jgi:hypothetical protein
MASPNIILANTIIGKTTLVAPTSTLSNVLVNSAGSGLSMKLNSVTYANGNANNVPLWCSISRGGVEYYLGNSITVPCYYSLVVVAKDTSIYLEEGDALKCNIGTTGVGTTSVTISYEVIS